jgi:hypothetical protein
VRESNVSTAQHEQPPTGDEERPGAPSLLLVKTDTVTGPEPASAESDDAESDEEHEEVEAYDDEEAPGFLVRLRVQVWEYIQGAGRWVRTQVREIVGILNFREFLTDTIADVAVASGYIPRAVGRWVIDPDPKTDEEGWKKRGIRAATAAAPVAFAAYVVTRPGGGRFMFAFTGGWVLLCWLTADTARRDAKMRKKAKKLKAKAAAKAKKAKLAKRYGLEETKKNKKKKDRKEVDQEMSGERGSTPAPQLTEEEIRAQVAAWVRKKISENPLGTNGIHLDPLYQAALKEGWTTSSTDRPTFRKVLEHRGIPVGQVNIGGTNLTGVKAKDVPRPRPGDHDWTPHASVSRHHQKTPQ